MAPDCPHKHKARTALYEAVKDCPQWGRPHVGATFTTALNTYQQDVMEPLRQNLRDAITRHHKERC